jgi:hypothetical protein
MANWFSLAHPLASVGSITSDGEGRKCLRRNVAVSFIYAPNKVAQTAVIPPIFNVENWKFVFRNCLNSRSLNKWGWGCLTQRRQTERYGFDLKIIARTFGLLILHQLLKWKIMIPENKPRFFILTSKAQDIFYVKCDIYNYLLYTYYIGTGKFDKYLLNHLKVSKFKVKESVIIMNLSIHR